MFDVMRAKITERREALGLKEREVDRAVGAWLGWTNNFMTARRKAAPKPRLVAELARVLEIRIDDLVGDSVETAELRERAKAIAIDRDFSDTSLTVAGAPQKVVAASDSIPLFSAGLPTKQAFVNLSPKPIGRVEVSRSLAAEPGAYAVAAFNTLNEPRYFLGEKVLVDPGLPVRIDDFVVIRRTDGFVAIARLADIGDSSITLSFVNAESVELETADMATIHRIVGATD
jgi:hypothetical protein